MLKNLEISLDNLDSHVREFFKKMLLPELKKYFKNNKKAFIIALNGDLGAGKTTWVRALLKALGFNNNVKSPTFNYVNEYPVNIQDFKEINILYHFDMYKIDDKSSFYELGLSELFEEDFAICIIEWPDKVSGLISNPNIIIDFSDKSNLDKLSKDSRCISYTENH